MTLAPNPCARLRASGLEPARPPEIHSHRRTRTLLPSDLPPRSTVYDWFALWRDTGLFERINHALVMADRERVGRAASPSAAVIDTQSVKTCESGGLRGYDAGKRVKGRKRPRSSTRMGEVSSCSLIPPISKTPPELVPCFISADGRNHREFIAEILAKNTDEELAKEAADAWNPYEPPDFDMAELINAVETYRKEFMAELVEASKLPARISSPAKPAARQILRRLALPVDSSAG